MELDQCGVSAYHLQVRGGLNLLSVDRAGFQFQFWTHHGCHRRTANRQPDGAFAEGRTLQVSISPVDVFLFASS